MKRLAIYVFHDQQGVVGDYVLYKLRALREHVSTLVVVSNGELTPAGEQALRAIADVVAVRDNVGFDVGGYLHGLSHVVGWDELGGYDELLLLNATFYAPIFPFSELFSRMDAQAVDFWGITAFNGPVADAGHDVIPFHLQSYFIAIRRSLSTSPAFRAYWQHLPRILGYRDSVTLHEVRFTEHFARQGFRFSVYVDPDKYAGAYAGFENIDLLLQDRCPVLKRRPFFHDPLHLDRECIDLKRALAALLASSTYDVGLVWRDITRVAQPRDLYTNASLLEILPDTEPAPALPRRKVAVFAHLYFPEMTEEVLGYARNIPGDFDLHLTTSSDEKKRAIEHLVADRFPIATLRVIPNRGRDIAALLVGMRDLALAGGYDYVCRLHSKVSANDGFNRARHFKEHLFENLLGSRAHVSRLLTLFEQEPQLGLVMPPVVHIGYPTLGQAWFNNRAAAGEWAEKLGIDLPFDEHTPYAAYGSMYWFRPAALARLFRYPFLFTDFAKEPLYGDGDLAHVLERLIVYVCHQSGYYAKCVLTPENAAKSYVKLEYKLQKRIGDEQRRIAEGSRAMSLWHEAQRPISTGEAEHFDAQLYWRSGLAGEFSESQSVTAHGQIGLVGQTLVFSLPSHAHDIRGLRFDPANRAGFIRVQAIRVFHRGLLLWHAEGDALRHVMDPIHQVVLAANVLPGQVLVSLGGDPALTVWLPDDVLQRLGPATVFEVTTDWPLSWEAAAAFVVRIDEQLGRLESKVAAGLEREKALLAELSGLRQALLPGAVRRPLPAPAERSGARP